MAKRSKRRRRQQPKDHAAGCMSGLISMFDFRHGQTTRRLLSDTSTVTKDIIGVVDLINNSPSDKRAKVLVSATAVGYYVYILVTCQPQASNGGATSASRAAKADGMHFSNKLHAFVEYETIESAEKAALELNKEGNWRHGLRVRLLRRPSQAKPAQSRGKKTGQEDEAVHKEDDTSTSEQHLQNEKQLDDTCQQSDVPSHEHVQGEDHPNDKEGGHKKGRSCGRGKGRGRSQYNHHNNRGTHMATPPSTNH